MLEVVERGRLVRFSFEDLLRYHGPGSPGGVAHAYKVLQRALPALSPDGPPERREITVRTAFGGPGARDGIEMATRAVSDGRFHLDPGLARPERGLAMERFVFVVGLGDRSVTLAVRDGYVDEELIRLARLDRLDTEQARRMDALKEAMAERVMASPADAVYDLSG